MLNIFKKSDSLQNVGGGSSNLEPPKHLPELAGDIYENASKFENSKMAENSRPLNEQANASNKINASSPAQTNNVSTNLLQNNSPDVSSRLENLKTEKIMSAYSPTSYNSAADAAAVNSQPMHAQISNLSNNTQAYNPALVHTQQKVDVAEPRKDYVPRLDLSLLKQPTNDVQNQFLPSMQSNTSSVMNPAIPVNQDYRSSGIQVPLYTAPQNPYLQSPIYSQSYPRDNQVPLNGSAIKELRSIDDSTGFFREFENYILENGLNTAIIDDLLEKNLLDHMMFYHTNKSEDMPFYASSAELSHAIKLKFENLQNTEKSWLINKQKLDVLKKVGLNMENDIRTMSEELKKLMVESKRRGVNVKPADFFSLANADQKQIEVNPTSRIQNNDNLNNQNSQVKIVEKIIPQMGIIHPQPASSQNLAANASLGNNSSSDLMHRSMLDNPSSGKYILSKYVLNDQSKYFYARNGQVFKSLSDLRDGIEHMDKTTFDYHVNDSKNDLANWVKGVFGDLRLSDALRPLDAREKISYFLKNNTL